MQKRSTINDQNEIATLLRQLRKERGLTQRALAQHAGVSFSFVNQVEGGKETLRLNTLQKLLEVFGYELAPRRIERNQK